MPKDLDSTTSKRKRRLPWKWGLALIGAIIYDISPIDIIPEGFFGPLGLADDALLTVAVLGLSTRAYFGSSKKDVARTS